MEQATQSLSLLMYYALSTWYFIQGWMLRSKGGTHQSIKVKARQILI